MLTNSLLLKLLRIRADELLAHQDNIAFLINRGMVIAKQMSTKNLPQFIKEHEQMLEAAKIAPITCDDANSSATAFEKLSHGAWLVSTAKTRDRHDALRLLGTYSGIREFEWLVRGTAHPVYDSEATPPDFAAWEVSPAYCKAGAAAMLDAMKNRGVELSDVGHGILGYYEGALWMGGGVPLDHFRSFGLASQTTN